MDPKSFDFNKLCKLAKEDPEAAEAMRLEIIEENIIKMSRGDEEQAQSLRRYQFRIDSELRKYKDPVARYNKMVELFWSGVKIFQKETTTMVDVIKNPDKIREVEVKTSAKVVQLKPKNNE